jgi:predicted GNAT family N-acyltransferase
MLANSVMIEGNWAELKAQLVAIRTQVFIIEQHVPIEIEWDDEDEHAIHLLALDDKETPIACARILKKGRIGRMAVLKAYRGTGLGRALLNQAIEICRRLNMPKITISSQTHAIKFYENAGFVVTSEAYIDANIWHKDMELIL